MADNNEQAYEKLTDLMKAAHTGALTTIDKEGKLVSRPMSLQSVEFEGDVWFFTSDKSTKADEIAANPQVNVSFQSGNSWVSLSGVAELVHNREKAAELWNTFVKAYFPDGLDDPDLALIKVRADSAEYWDSDNKLVSLFKMAKAAATDNTPDLGDNKTLTL